MEVNELSLVEVNELKLMEVIPAKHNSLCEAHYSQHKVLNSLRSITPK